MKAEAMWDSLANGWDKPGVSLGENDTRIIASIFSVCLAWSQPS